MFAGILDTDILLSSQRSSKVIHEAVCDTILIEFLTSYKLFSCAFQCGESYILYGSVPLRYSHYSIDSWCDTGRCLGRNQIFYHAEMGNAFKAPSLVCSHYAVFLLTECWIWGHYNVSKDSLA